MAETTSHDQASQKDLEGPQGNFEGWDEKTTPKEVKYYTRTADKDGKTLEKLKDASGPEVADHGPSFSNVSCNWTPGTSGYTSSGFASETGITSYSLDNIFPFTYKLQFMTDQSYDYFFNTQYSSYENNVFVTTWGHEITFATFNDSTIISVSGS